MIAYYNEIDPYAAAWLRNLINAGHIAPGIVDERSIEDVFPSDLRGFTQCHFFAGIGVWSHALRSAGWSDDRPVWTGSCPCQPFSSAGQGAGFDDERHLWPHWHHLIKECRPAVILGEQVASSDSGPWLDLVQDDLEDLVYAFGAVPFPAAGVGAPHIRDRLYWVADASSARLLPRAQPRVHRCKEGAGARHGQPERHSAARWLADTDQHGRAAAPLDRGDHAEHHAESRCEPGRLEHAGQHHDAGEGQAASAGQSQADRSADQLGGPSIPLGRLGHAHGVGAGWLGRAVPGQVSGEDGQHVPIDADAPGAGVVTRPGPANGQWATADWLACRDGKWRPVEPGTFPLAHGAPARVGRLRAYGNAIVAPAARVFIEAVMEGQPA